PKALARRKSPANAVSAGEALNKSEFPGFRGSVDLSSGEAEATRCRHSSARVFRHRHVAGKPRFPATRTCPASGVWMLRECCRKSYTNDRLHKLASPLQRRQPGGHRGQSWSSTPASLPPSALPLQCRGFLATAV